MSRSLAVPSDPHHFATRYELHEQLGRGGMAVVHRATDRVLGRPVALKQLTVSPQSPERAHMAALFEREFHTLAQLSHPHVIGVFDYGLLVDSSPFYTMELLDGGDLRERAPLPWRELCRLMFDVCSALALVHSRRLLHRDITPRNIRCTQAGIAKLIDFGALSPMSAGGSDVVGTPAFTAPETLQRLALDARTDLYTFGVTLYHALTGRLPYNVRAFAELMGAWESKPPAPSELVSGIPAALDDLVLSLISPEPALRPASAFEVMQRLAACAGLQAAESEAVSRAYLSTPTLVGRAAELQRLQDALRDARLRKSAGLIIEGASGSGRSRLLDACALDALTRGFSVSRATATGAREPFAVAQRLVQHILDTQPRAAEVAAIPELFSGAAAAADDASARPVLRNVAELEAGVAQKLLRRFILGVSRAQPLLIAVDDVHQIDEPSAALLAELIDGARGGGILVLLTADSLAPDNDAWHALARRCQLLSLAPLTREQTGELLDSLFGAMTNLDLLRDEIHAVALGNPRQTLELAQHLVDRGLIRYTAGRWTLPAKLSAEDLPRSASAAMRARIERFSPHARFLAEAQALAFHEEFSDGDYRTLMPQVSSGDVELAILELLGSGAVLRDGAVYRMANRVWTAAFVAGLDEEQTQLRHRMLSDLYAGKSRAGHIHHTFSGGLHERGLEAMERRDQGELGEGEALKLAAADAGRMMWVYPLALATAQKLGRSPREICDMRRWQYIGSVVSPLPPDRASARLYLEQVMHDCGLDLYRSDTHSATAQERLMSSLQRAYERHVATPEHERVYPVDLAIRRLGEYVLIAVVEGARALDSDLLYGLPDYLEPYVSLSPLLEAIYLNMRGAREGHCHSNWQGARELWLLTLEKVAALGSNTEGFVEAMRNAVVFALGSAEAQLGLLSAAAQAERLESDAFQRISALALRKIVRLEQGDAEGAERFRRQAEVLSLQQRMPQMFVSSLAFEVFVYCRCNHLAGLTQTIEQLKPMAARFPTWLPLLWLAEGCFQLVRGDFEAALAKLEEGLRPGGPTIYFWTWMSLQACLCECLLALGRTAEARDRAIAALAETEKRGTGVSAFELIHVLALAEAKLGDARAAERLDALIARQNALGASGLRLGLSYEARARVAIWSGDAPAFERFSELTAREYRHGVRTSLAARYERLMNEAARAGMQAKLTLAEFQSLGVTTQSTLGGTDLLSIVTRSMAGQQSIAERAQVALQMICTTHAAREGHLFLSTPAGAVLRASQSSAPPTEALAERVSQYMAEQQRQAAELDDMQTDVEAESSEALEAGSHELLALRCVVEAESVLVGVAVISRSERAERGEPQSQLLQLLAASLIESGEARIKPSRSP